MKTEGLYDPEQEHDSCGVGFVADIKGVKRHDIVSDGLNILKNLVHRGALSGDMKTGDGCGILTQIPHEFFSGEFGRLGIKLPGPAEYGVGMLFLPKDPFLMEKAVKMTEKVIAGEGACILGFRDVPVKPDCLGKMALETMPHFKQVFVTVPGLSDTNLERKLYVIRKLIEAKARESAFSMEDFYLPSFSCKTIIYKGMFVAAQLEAFYPDLCDPGFKSCLAMVHQRYSTNTFPSWALAHPFRYISHNGEINTLRGNINKMKAREKTLASTLFGDDVSKLFPITTPNASDSAIFDNVYELLVLGGRSMEHAMMMMVPEPFGTKYHISEDKRAFYEFHAAVMEPWDGPAAIAFTDGERIGAVLDRNGLRPARYVISKNGKIVLASEVGVLDFAPEEVIEKGRLAPGKMLLVDTLAGRILRDNEIKASVSRQAPYREWLKQNRIELRGLFQIPEPFRIDENALKLRLNVFGYTLEELKMILEPMAESGQEPVNSMGNDASLAVLSRRPQLLYNYFKQLFAQVTNPPIDPYRENLVMSLMAFTGRERNLLEQTPLHCHQLKLPHPVLTNEDIQKLKKGGIPDYKICVLPMIFRTDIAGDGLRRALSALCAEAEKNVDQGVSMIILSDRDISDEAVPIPALLATSCVHHYLVKKCKRHLTGLVIETGEARDVMHFATLVGYGASAVNPYLAYEAIVQMFEKGEFPEGLSLEAAIDNYITALKKGLLKILSKMGISTIRSYKSAQIFEAVGLHSDLIDEFFPGTSSRIGGIGLDIVEKEVRMRHANAYEKVKYGIDFLDSGGHIQFRKDTEDRRVNPETVTLLQKAVRENDYQVYKKYTEAVNEQNSHLCTPRGLFKFKPGKAIPLDEVECEENIIKRFITPAMSFGSISKEAHETMAIAMNRLGAASNSGEGGEEEERYTPLENGDSLKSAIKQVASGRFGVTINYLVNSKELQIKMAQGAKPGEGGQLPGHKVDKVIAKVRHSTPGVMLISPPPHHDIYSIEDLAQLIFDLKNANRDARISVKLVSEVGVGTVAAGVAKGKAEMVLISGHDGGTGASPISSIKYAGIPWEIGLAETQQTLVKNSLRDKIRVQTDGKLMTGRDVVIGALLGAEEFGFGTVSLLTLGCVMMRKCHLNTCPVGVATQDPNLRKKFAGKPEHIINFMRFVARDVRSLMAELGFRTFNEMVGQVDRLDVHSAVNHWKTGGLDFSKLFVKPEVPEGCSLYCTGKQEHDFSESLDLEILKKVSGAVENKTPVSIEMPVRNKNRTVGAMLSSEIARKYGADGLPDDTIHCKFKGSAGQSFGAFLAKGVTFELEGDTNDFLGKGLSGGKIILYPDKKSVFRPEENIIAGNVNLFGATGGELYIGGMAGERFAVRNSGAVSVVEGVGDHACEYMTGGVVVVLGQTGINFAAGMSGGIAFILDENQLFDTKCNLEMVNIEPVSDRSDQQLLYRLVENHVRYTGSKYAASILHAWSETFMKFVKVMPVDYKKALLKLKKEESKETELVGMTEEVLTHG